ncbi:MAG TPA: hypothetical protein VGL62_13010 [Vicinamibacterales bacterium]|jgi:hypothetical protein
MLAAGIEPGRLVPISGEHGTVEPLAADGGLASMLCWSDEPLEIFLDDPRSPARRLPSAELAWIETHEIALIVPVIGKDRTLVAALALGPKRSEEAYTADDRDLLAGIAVQAGLGFDVARLRRETDERLLRAPTLRNRTGCAAAGVPALRPDRGGRRPRMSPTVRRSRKERCRGSSTRNIASIS